MSAWTDLGLPLPNAKGYGYVRDAALLRTPFDNALPDQDQKNANWRKTFNVSWNLSLEQLSIAEQYLLQYGYSWFDLELVSNETPIDELISIHQIRLISNYTVKPIGGIYFQLSANIESRVVPQSCATIICDTLTNFEEPQCEFTPELTIIVPTTLYPVELYDELSSNSQIVSGFLSPYDDDAYVSRHVFLSGTIEQTKILVPVTQQPDAYTSSHVFKYGEIYEMKTLAPITQPPDAYTSAHIFTFGDIFNDYISTNVSDSMTSTATIESGTWG